MKRLIPIVVLTLASLQPLRAQDIPVRYGYPTALHGEIAVVLDKAGIAKKHGLDPQATFFQYGPPQIEALAASSIDLAFTSLVPTASLASKQPDAIEVIALLGHSSHGLVVPGDSSINKLSDLNGKKIGVAFGSDSHADLLASLKEAGLSPATDVTLVNIAPAEQPAAFEQHLVDGVIFRQPQLYKFLQKGNRELIRWPHHFWVIARSEWLKAHPDAKPRFLAALRETIAFVSNNPRQSAEWFAEVLRIDPDLVQKLAAENPIFSSNPASLSLIPSPDFRAFVDKRSQELADSGLTKSPAHIKFSNESPQH